MEDDVFHGYYIPKGATIVLNAWSVVAMRILAGKL